MVVATTVKVATNQMQTIYAQLNAASNGKHSSSFSNSVVQDRLEIATLESTFSSQNKPKKKLRNYL